MRSPQKRSNKLAPELREFRWSIWSRSRVYYQIDMRLRYRAGYLRQPSRSWWGFGDFTIFVAISVNVEDLSIANIKVFCHEFSEGEMRLEELDTKLLCMTSQNLNHSAFYKQTSKKLFTSFHQVTKQMWLKMFVVGNSESNASLSIFCDESHHLVLICRFHLSRGRPIGIVHGQETDDSSPVERNNIYDLRKSLRVPVVTWLFSPESNSR